MTTILKSEGGVARRTAGVFAAALVLAAGLHGWPVQHIPALKLLWPAQLVLVAWCGLVALEWGDRAARGWICARLPGTCVWAYLAACALSIAGANDLGRAATALAKTTISLVGAYLLIRGALENRRNERFFALAVMLTVSAVLGHAIIQNASHAPAVGLFDSHLKLGTFLASSLPVALGLLVARKNRTGLAWALLMFIAGLLVCASAWAWIGIVAGTVVACWAVSPRWLIAALLAGAVAVTVAHRWDPRKPPVIADMQMQETAGPDVRQRYLEWQASINLLAQRAATGTGIGCFNDYRSQYYERLPKNNTIAAFDQNGYLTAAAELGLPGLVALCWMLGEHLCRGWRRRSIPFARVATAGLLGGAVAQLGSSLTYNGILIMAAVLMACIDARPEGEHALAE